ncbi:Methyltransferase domain-containing protein [Modicisalibacter ilicicola DSM 19980]|uniref:Methyltransferase domain-containing protein n=2 Tax=Modicisalibacter ilicicola TaxID=480814 RepID=A0A1M5E2S2_9GAMM|nr:Methyltransferase domain-containing protein [Halomonas ilicicola DSM 19980]
MTISLAQTVRQGRLYWASPAGKAHWQAERACIGPVCERLFGVRSLHLGMAPRLTDMCPIRHSLAWSPTRELAEDEACLVCNPGTLPLPDDSLSLVVVHHLLEVAPEPHRVLQEATRVVADNGCLVIFGWFPLGVEGLRRVCSRSRSSLPWRGKWRTPGRLRDWLEFVDFEIERVDYCGFRLPGRPPGNARLESLGRRYNLPLGDTYMIRARRRMQRAQIVRPRLATPAMGRPMLGNSPRIVAEQERERVSEVD